eukprot:SM000132S26878  [mRNA]  locus=s132:184330:184774:- [translate_table: standard]
MPEYRTAVDKLLCHQLRLDQLSGAKHEPELAAYRLTHDVPKGAREESPFFMDIHGCYGGRWSSLLSLLASQADQRRREQGAALPGGSVPFKSCVLLPHAFIYSQALALHRRAGRVLAAASGLRSGVALPLLSSSDFLLLTRGY